MPGIGTLTGLGNGTSGELWFGGIPPDPNIPACCIDSPGKCLDSIGVPSSLNITPAFD